MLKKNQLDMVLYATTLSYKSKYVIIAKQLASLSMIWSKLLILITDKLADDKTEQHNVIILFIVQFVAWISETKVNLSIVLVSI